MIDGKLGICKHFFSTRSLYDDLAYNDFNAVEYFARIASIKGMHKFMKKYPSYLKFYISWKACESFFVLPIELEESSNSFSERYPGHTNDYYQEYFDDLVSFYRKMSSSIEFIKDEDDQVRFWPMLCTNKFIKLVDLTKKRIVHLKKSEIILKLIRKCDAIWTNMVGDKLKILGPIGKAAKKWMFSLSEYVSSLQLDPSLLDPRSDRSLAYILKTTFLPKLINSKFDIEILYLRSAFYTGDGLCFHILQKPVSNLRPILQILFDNFSNDFEYVKNMKHDNKSILNSVYYLILTCEKLEANPIDEAEEKSIFPENEISFSKSEFFRALIENIQVTVNTKHSRCVWKEVAKVRWLNQQVEISSEYFETVEHVTKFYIDNCLEQYQAIESKNISMFVECDGETRLKVRTICDGFLYYLSNILLKALDKELEFSLNDLTDQRNDPSFIIQLIKKSLYESRGEKIQSFIDGSSGFCSLIMEKSIYDNDMDEVKNALEFYARIASIKKIERHFENRRYLRLPGILRYYLTWRICESFYLLPFV